MTLSLQVIYPVSEGTHFDMDYYQNTHFGLVDTHMASHIEPMVITRGLAGGPDTPPGFYAVATILFADQAAMDAAMAAAGPVIEDIAKFTDVAPQMLIGDVIS